MVAACEGQAATAVGAGVPAMLGCEIFGCERHDLPDGEGWGEERVTINSHIGTHVDAPLHYGSTCEGGPARTIEKIGLDELYVDGLVLDVRGLVEPNEGIAVEALEQAFAANGGEVTAGCAIMLRTGQEAYGVADVANYAYPGMTRAGTLHLAALGAKVLGTDALGWDGHFAGRDHEVFIVQQLDNLASLPPNGFKVAFFPMKLAHCSAAPARVVAFVP